MPIYPRFISLPSVGTAIDSNVHVALLHITIFGGIAKIGCNHGAADSDNPPARQIYGSTA
jgi:hypothetical protein